MKEAASKLWRPALRVGASVLTAGITEHTGTLVDSVVVAAKDEMAEASEKFWRKEDGKRAAMRQFVQTLAALTAQTDEKAKAHRLIIVVDELDRCRPDYALSLLEVVKHFFAVPNVHFVLGVNLDQLKNSVTARYGSGIDAQLYLQRFITLSVELPQLVGEPTRQPVTLKYFSSAGRSMGLSDNFLGKALMHLERLPHDERLSIRGAQRLLTLMVLLPQEPTRFEYFVEGYKELIASLLVMRIFRLETYERVKNRSVSFDEVREMYGLPQWMNDDTKESREAYSIYLIWKWLIEPGNLTEDQRTHAARRLDRDHFGQADRWDVVESVLGLVEPLKLTWPLSA